MKSRHKVSSWLIIVTSVCLCTIKVNAQLPNLSALWLFSEGSGTTSVDSSGNGNTATLHNSPTWIAAFNGNEALQFSGSAYVSAANSPTLADQGLGSNITLCAWVKRSPYAIGSWCSV